MNHSIIENYYDDILETLSQLIAIPSIAEETGDPKMPFGEKATEALDFILEKARSLGFKTENIGNAAGYAEYVPAGAENSTDYAGVLTHVDVVPVDAAAWNTDPFKLTLIDGVLYGRGVADDKGGAVVSLYCMKAMADAGISGKRPIRCIFGCGEEIGMGDMETFFAAQPLPSVAFTPDSGYTVCNREKGIMHAVVTLPESCSDIAAFDAGSAINCVAAKAELVLSTPLDDRESLECRLRDTGCEYSISQQGEQTILTVIGQSAHAMQPDRGINAASAVINAICGGTQSDAIKTIAKLFCSDLDGSALGVNRSDEPSGALTMNLGFVHLKDGQYEIGIDIRYPVTADGGEISAQLRRMFAENGMTEQLLTDVKPIYMPEDSPLIRMLCGCYEEVTGQPADIYSTGGGTYARALGGRGLAFGMEFPDSPETKLHENNEQYLLEDLKRHAHICLSAMIGLVQMDVCE